MIKHNFFKTIDSEIKAYLLGFLAADGNIDSKTNRISILLNKKDIEILKLFQFFICPESKIYDKHDLSIKRDPQVLIRFSSKELKTDLFNYGIIPNKTKSEFNIDNIPKEYRKHYIRGYFDGDGCFYYKKWRGRNKVCVNFTNSTKSILESINKELKEININFKLEVKTSKTNNTYYVLAAYSQKNLLNFGNWLYLDSIFYLKRKFEKFNFINTVVSSKIAKGLETP